MDNMKIYNSVRVAPKNALKAISAGRLKGMTDINPMWRIQALTKQFGPVGVGWYYTIEKQWLETGANGEICAFTNIQLFVKVDGEWSMPIEGTGGSMLVTKESKGMYTSDECFKKSLTDAISVACKALGFAADVYWKAGGDSKYPTGNIDPVTEQPMPTQATDEQYERINSAAGQLAELANMSVDKIFDNIEKQYGKMENFTPQVANQAIGMLAQNIAKYQG